MGWTFYHRPAGQTDRQHFESELGLAKRDLKILESATKNGTFYAAVQDPDGSVWALVILIQRVRGEYNFGYKDMDETVGPAVHDCPAKVLDLLTPTDSQWANEWRVKCRATLARNAQVKALVNGTVIELEKPVTFANDVSVQRFEYRKEGRSTVFLAFPEGEAIRPFRCRLGADWASRYNWKVAS